MSDFIIFLLCLIVVYFIFLHVKHLKTVSHGSKRRSSCAIAYFFFFFILLLYRWLQLRKFINYHYSSARLIIIIVSHLSRPSRININNASFQKLLTPWSSRRSRKNNNSWKKNRWVHNRDTCNLYFGFHAQYFDRNRFVEQRKVVKNKKHKYFENILFRNGTHNNGVFALFCFIFSFSISKINIFVT